ncbi:PspC domain-containing protein [Nocardioides caldifontis]|uniref:PspC domain-containing protein n=1 Tax=Nocardioides caldifontis TaxID=2588938 RepID=UPI001396A388|nr:PspC domain-containing protein [Nocardioides caldifontis]
MTETPGQGGVDAGSVPPPPPPPPPGWNSDNLRDYRRLRRSRTDRKIAGVAGGLGRHLDIDPTIIRVLLVVLVFFGGAGLLLYGAMWLLVPEEHTGDAVIRTSDSTRNALLIGAAVLAGLAAVGDAFDGYGFPWPLAVAAILVAVVLSTRDRGARSQAAPPPPPGTPTGPPSAPVAPPAWYPPTPPPPPPAPRRRRGPLLFGPTLALLAVTFGGLGVYEAAGGTVSDAAYPAAATAVIGVMLLVGAFYGRAGGLIALGVVSSVVLAGTAIGDPGFDGERDLLVRPRDAASLESGYDVPAGRLELDLTEIDDLSELDGRKVELDVNAGEVLVVLPEELRVRYDTAIEFGGEIVTPEGNSDGWGPSRVGVLEETAESTLDLEVDLRFGRIEVRQQ